VRAAALKRQVDPFLAVAGRLTLRPLLGPLLPPSLPLVAIRRASDFAAYVISKSA